jgi:hypothetical protein
VAAVHLHANLGPGWPATGRNVQRGGRSAAGPRQPDPYPRWRATWPMWIGVKEPISLSTIAKEFQRGCGTAKHFRRAGVTLRCGEVGAAAACPYRSPSHQ